MILPFKQMIQDYMDTNNILVLNQAIKFYIDEMLPKLKEIQELKYDVNFVEFNPEDNKYHLVQYPNSLENGEFWVKSDDKVVKFIKGVRKERKSKTIKSLDNVMVSKKKTRKIRPMAELIIEEDEDISPVEQIKEDILEEDELEEGEEVEEIQPELTFKIKDELS